MTKRSAMQAGNTMMRTFKVHAKSSSEGAALIICLGLLSVMTILSVAFAISMRIERVAARNFADTIRAKQLIHVALVRAYQDINETMLDPSKNPTPTPMPMIYPDWESLPRGPSQLDVMWSYRPDGEVVDLLEGEAMSFIPGDSDSGDNMDLKRQAHFAKTETTWITNDVRRGKVSYVVVNTSGLVDVNKASASSPDRLYSTNINEIDISGTTDFVGTTGEFDSQRKQHGRYETLGELSKINDAISEIEVSSFNTFSYDVNRDKVFLTIPKPHGDTWWTSIDLTRPAQNLGRRDAEDYLHDKFNLNSITNFLDPSTAGRIDRYVNDEFRDKYLTPLVGILDYVLPPQERPEDVAWNIINYLDEDRIPQGADNQPWTHTEGGEPIPMINEIVVEEVAAPGDGVWAISRTEGGNTLLINDATGPAYHISIELWYPYAPVKVSSTDKFRFKLGIYDYSRVTGLDIEFGSTIWIDEPIDEMEFGTPTEFKVFDDVKQTIGFHQEGDSHLVNIIDNTPGFYFIAQVTKENADGDDIPVDEAIKTSFRITRPRVFQVNDPRSNGQRKYWVGYDVDEEPLGGANGDDWHPSVGHSLGEMNLTPKRTIRGFGNQPVCDPWSFRGQGLPIYATNGVMRNISELGHIFRSNLDDEEINKPHLWYWRTLNLMHKEEGAKLLDVLTVRGNSGPTEGLFCINSRQTEPLQALFHNLKIGIKDVEDSDLENVRDSDVAEIVNYLVDPPVSVDEVFESCTSFTDMFTSADGDEGGGGDLAEAFRLCAPAVENSRLPSHHRDPNDIYEEDTFRHICELITFRQNIFTIILGAQALAPRGDTVVAEKRAVASVYRDAYTGRHFIKSFKWLDD